MCNVFEELILTVHVDIEEKLETKDCVIQELKDNICNYKEQIKGKTDNY